MKNLHVGLLPRILIAIVLGVIFGNFFPALLVRIFVTFNGIFSEFLNFIIPLIIVGLVTPAIFEIGNRAGKMLVITAVIAYVATLISGFLAYFTGVTIFPRIIESNVAIETISQAQGVTPFFLGGHTSADERDDGSRTFVYVGIGVGWLVFRRIKKSGSRF